LSSVAFGSIDFFLTQLDHQMMVLGIVIDVAGDVLLFNAADAMFQTRRAR
jgi:hypothetical protein